MPEGPTEVGAHALVPSPDLEQDYVQWRWKLCARGLELSVSSAPLTLLKYKHRSRTESRLSILLATKQTGTHGFGAAAKLVSHAHS